MLNDLFSALGIKPLEASEISKPVALGRLGALGAIAAYLPGEGVKAIFWTQDGPSSVMQILVSTAAWMVVYAIGYSLALIIGQNRYLHRPWLNLQEGLMAVFGGAIFGVLSGALAQGFFSIAVVVGQGNPVLVEMARIVAWAIFGTLIGFGMSFIIPNLGRLQGSLGGGAGGAIGAIGFIICTFLAGDALGRFIGMAIVGFALGYAIGMVEEASRTAWLQVAYGNSRETVRVSLGPDLVCVGSNSQRCAVWAKGARNIALRFRFTDGRVVCDDMTTERSMVVEHGFEQQVGNVIVTVCTTGGTAGATLPSAPSQQRPPVSAPPIPPRVPPVPLAPGAPLAPAAVRAPTAVRAAPAPAASQARKPAPLPPPPPPPPPRPPIR